MDQFLRQLDFQRWADTSESKWILPHALRRLIWSTVRGISAIDFPAYEAGNRPGFDGVVDRGHENHPWVPEGRSVWELGTDRGFRSKADRDLRKRSDFENTPQDEQEMTSYVFVTPRRFDKKNDWIEEHASTGKWRRIRVIDANDLEQWAETAPAGIRTWLGRLLGSRPLGVDDIASRWDAIATTSPCRLVPEVFLAGREQSVGRLREWISGHPTRLALECRSPSELLDFFCATVAAKDEAERIDIESRSVIVADLDSWTVLRDRTPSSILVIDPSLELSREEINRAILNQHHVLVATDPILNGQRLQELERAPQFELAKALEESGFSPAVAEKYARAAGGSLAILKNQLTPPNARWTPHWASSVSPDVVSACLLLGGWDSSEADQAAFSRIAGRTYAECQTDLQIMASSRDPLLLHAAGKWRLISKDFAWSLFEARVTASALERFEGLALEILADDDPRYLLPEEDRFLANVKGHVPKYSETIKRHVAETLAFLGAFGESLQVASSTDIIRAIDRIVASVVSESVTWHRWASIGSSLPLLAEASPRSFLAAVEATLKQQDSAVVRLFHEEEEPMFGACNHAGLLWALEALAWSTRSLPQVAVILLELVGRVSPNSRWSNRPQNSLREILSYWMPHTMANVDERIQVLDLLVRRNGEAAWGVLLGLLPSPGGGVSHPTHMPYWRDWADSWERGATRGESHKFLTATAEKLIDLTGTNAARWHQLFKHIGQFPFTVKERLIAAAKQLVNSEISDTDRRLVSEELSKQINRHRHFQSSDWAIPEDVLKEFEAILNDLKPQDCVLRNAWLFEQWPDRYFDAVGSHEERQSALDRARIDAINEILSEHEFAGVESLIKHSASPGDVGRTLAMATADRYLNVVIPGNLESESAGRSFASGFVWNRFWNLRWDWIDRVIPICDSANAISRLLEAVEFSPEAWNRADAAGVEVAELYWGRCRAFNPELDEESVAAAVMRLLTASRAIAAIDLVSTALYKKHGIDQDTLFTPLEALLTQSSEHSSRENGQSDRYHIQQIIETLQQTPNVDENRLASIEWQYIRLLDDHHGHAPKTLRKQLSASPAFFNEVLSACYRPRHRDNAADNEIEPDHQRKYMAEHGFKLLHDWDLVPGTDENGEVNEEFLREWCTEARSIALAADRLEVCDNHLGQVFANSQETDENGAWPCAAVRRVAEEIETSSLASGMSCGIHNSRGVTFRASGGDQERELQQQYRSKAELIRFDSLFVAGILDSVADSYQREAAWWDERERWED